MKTTHAILLAGTAVAAVVLAAPSLRAAAPDGWVMAQAAPPPPDDKAKPAPPPQAAPPKPPAPPAAQAPAPKPPAPPAAQAPAPKPPAPPAAQAPAPKPPAPPAAQAPAQKPPAPPAAQAPAPKPPAPPAAQAPAPKPPAPPAADAKPSAPPPPRADRPERPQPNQGRAERREDRRDERREDRGDNRRDATPPAAAKPADQRPAAAQGNPPPPAAQGNPPPPAAQGNTPPPPAAQGNPSPAQPPAAAAPQPNQPAAASAAPPTKPRDASEFIRRGNGQARGLDDLRRERREVRDGDRVTIQEGDRTIIREGNRTIIRHSEAERFAIGARDVRVDRRGNETVSVVVRPDGFSIVTTTDNNGHLLRRVRRDRNGREVVIIDNTFPGARRGPVFVDLPPPVIRIPRERYIVDAGRATPAQIYTVFTAPPVQPIDERYTVEQVRYSAPLRDRMPRVDLDVNFESGSWQLTPDQVDTLAEIAAGLKRAIQANAREVFLIEGHTDAVGSEEDNLSLSDRRAEAVAVALTEQFQVPPENLVTQGYGEETLKVQTEGAERANRYVAVRRITPLISQAQTQGGPR